MKNEIEPREQPVAARPSLFWCNTHERRAEYLDADGTRTCLESGKTTLPCDVVDLSAIAEIE